MKIKSSSLRRPSLWKSGFVLAWKSEKVINLKALFWRIIRGMLLYMCYPRIEMHMSKMDIPKHYTIESVQISWHSISFLKECQYPFLFFWNMLYARFPAEMWVYQDSQVLYALLLFKLFTIEMKSNRVTHFFWCGWKMTKFVLSKLGESLLLISQLDCH